MISRLNGAFVIGSIIHHQFFNLYLILLTGGGYFSLPYVFLLKLSLKTFLRGVGRFFIKFLSFKGGGPRAICTLSCNQNSFVDTGHIY